MTFATFTSGQRNRLVNHSFFYEYNQTSFSKRTIYIFYYSEQNLNNNFNIFCSIAGMYFLEIPPILKLSYIWKSLELLV